MDGNNESQHRQNTIQFDSTLGVDRIPPDILQLVPDVPGIVFKSSYFVKGSSEPKSVPEVEKLKIGMHEMAALCFPVGSVWQRKEFDVKFTAFASRHNFACSIDSNRYWQCKCYGKVRQHTHRAPSNSAKLPNESNTIKHGCKFRVSTTYLWSYPSQKKGGSRRGWFTEEDKDTSLIVITAVPLEDHNHDMGKEFFQKTIQKSGFYAREISPDIIRLLIMMKRNNPTLSDCMMRPILEAASPQCKVWTSESIGNMRVKINRMYNHMKPSEYADMVVFEKSFQSQRYQQIFNSSNSEASFTDKVSKEARTRLHEYLINQLNTGGTDNETPSMILKWNNEMKEIDEYFDFRIMPDAECRIVGIVWMTGQMRRNLELFGSYIMMDMMKKQMNSSLFLYSGLVMNRPNGKLCHASEALCATEDLPTYKFQVDATFEMAHKRKKEDVNVIAADAILSQNSVRDVLGFPNALYIRDQFHLVQVNICDLFKGTNHFEELKSDIYAWIDSSSEEVFERKYDDLTKRMADMKCGAAQLGYFKKLLDVRESFAIYKLRSCKGTFGRKGNSGSEANHSSVLSNLGKDYFGTPLHMQSELLHRQKLWDYKSMRTYENEKLLLSVENASASNQALKAASSNEHGVSLDYTTFKLFKEQINLSHRLEVDKSNDDRVEIFDPVTREIHIFESPDDPCTCEFAIADLIQCQHKYCLLEKYVPELFDIRCKYQEKPCDSRIKRNDIVDGIDTEEESDVIGNFGTTVSASSDIPGNAYSLRDNQESSVIDTKLDYNTFLKLGQELAGAVSRITNRDFKKRVVGLLLSVKKIATNGIQSYTTSLVKAFQSYTMIEKASAGDTCIKDPNSMNTAYSVPKARILNRHEIQSGTKSNGTKRPASSNTGSSKRYSTNSQKPQIDTTRNKQSNTCSFCKSSLHPSMAKCPVKYSIGGIQIKNSDEKAFIDKLRFTCDIGPVVVDKEAPPGILKKGNTSIARHFIVHSVHVKSNSTNTNLINENNLCLQVTSLCDDGTVYEHCQNRMVDCYDFMLFVGARAKTRLLFDRIDIDGKGEGFLYRDSSASVVSLQCFFSAIQKNHLVF